MEKGRSPLFLRKAFLLFRFRSVFSKIIIILSILIIGILGLMHLVTNRNYQKNYQENRINSGFVALDLTGDQMEEQILRIKTQVEELLDVSVLEGIVVSGDVYSNPQTLDVVQELKLLDDDNELVQDVFLFIENNNILISSNQTVRSLAETEEYGVVNYYRSLESHRDMLFFEGDFYTFRELPEGRRMAICGVKLDLDVFYNQFTETMSTLKLDYPVYPFLMDEPLFSDQLNYPPDSEFMVVGHEERNYGDVLCELPDKKGVLLAHDSGELDMQLLAFLRSEENPVSTAEILREGLPVWIITAMVVLMVGVILIIVVYRPLANVLNYIMSQQSPKAPMPEDIRDEFELITGLFRQQKTYERELSELLQKTGEAVTERVFLDIIEGNEQSEESVRALLSQIQEEYDEDASYQIILLDAFKEDEALMSTSEQEMNKILIRQFCKDYWNDNVRCNILNRKGQQTILVLSFSKDYSVRQINVMVAEFAESCASSQEAYNIMLVLGISSLHKNLFSLPEAMAEAKTDLQEKMYYSIHGKGKRDVETIYRNKIQRCLERMIREPEEAERELEAILVNSVQYPDEVTNIWLNYMDSVLEHLLRYRIPCAPHWMEWRRQLSGEAGDIPEMKEQQAVLRRFYNETSVKLREASGYVQMQYLDLATRYIKAHYDDSNLSLVIVSENCGISKGYLSKLFTQYSNENFTDYLNRYRVQQACELLKNTSFTILDVGLKTGFNSPQSFSRVFKKYMSCTPTQYRMQKRGELSDEEIL